MRVGEVPSAALAGRLSRQGLRLDTGAFSVELRIEHPEVADAFAALYADHRFEDDPGIDDFRLRIAPTTLWRRLFRPQLQAYIDGEKPFQPMPARAGIAMLESALNWCVAVNVCRYLVVHSAAVERGGRAIMLPGPTGSGKSTLCAAMAARGWRLLSDEFAILRPGDIRLLPNPRPMSLKNDAIALMADFAPEFQVGALCEGTNKGTVAFLRPPREAVERAKETAAPGLAVVPRFRAGEPARLEPMRKAEAFSWFVDNSVNYFAMLRTGFETLADTIEACACYRLTYHDLDEALGLLGRAHAEAAEPGRAA